MTDAEMVKAMEICKDKEIPCDDCPLVECGDCEGISRQYFYDRFKQLQSENAALRERLDITKMALEYACLETLQSNEQYLEELKEKVNKYIKQSEDVVYGQKNGATFRFAEVRLTELKGGKNE